MKRKILVSVAPVSAAKTELNYESLVKEIRCCAEMGAAMVHLHVRDAKGRLTSDMALLEACLKELRRDSDIIIEVSTGGVSDLSIEDRCRPCYSSLVEGNSLNVGSVNLGNAVYINRPSDVEYCVQEILKNGKFAETELFEVGMANTLRELDKKYHFPRPLFLALVCGHPGEMPATEAGMNHLITGVYDNFLENEVLWGYTEAHRENWNLMKYALERGASALRIGFEDSDWLENGRTADSNVELIEKAVSLIREMGMEPMSPREARKLLGISTPNM